MLSGSRTWNWVEGQESPHVQELNSKNEGKNPPVFEDEESLKKYRVYGKITKGNAIIDNIIKTGKTL